MTLTSSSVYALARRDFDEDLSIFLDCIASREAIDFFLFYIKFHCGIAMSLRFVSFGDKKGQSETENFVGII